jgi:hypothetical protein
MQFSPFIESSSDSREGISLQQQGLNIACRLIENQPEQVSYNSVYRGESQSEYGL